MTPPCLSILLILFTSAVAASAQGGSKSDYERAATLNSRTRGKTFRARIEPHWLPGGESFWYRNDLPGGRKEFIQINAVTGERTIIDDSSKLPTDPQESIQPRPSRESSTETELRFANESGQEVRLFWIDPQGRRKPYGTLAAGESRSQHTFAGHVWLVQAADGATLGVYDGKDVESDAIIKAGRPGRNRRTKEGGKHRRVAAFIRDFNVWIRHRESGEEAQLSRNGSADDPYQEPFLWSPDGTKLVVQQIKPAQEHKVSWSSRLPEINCNQSSRAMTISKRATALLIRVRGSLMCRCDRRSQSLKIFSPRRGALATSTGHPMARAFFFAVQ
jgi:hypothetical protein